MCSLVLPISPPDSRRVNSGPVTGATVHYGFTRLPSTTYPVLTVTATDALGRAVTATRIFTVAGSLRDANLRLNGATARDGYLRLRGSINSGARGKVSVTATRIGTKGTNRARRSFRIVSGRYSGRLRLAPGRYRLRVAYRGSKSVNAAVARKTVRLR